MPWNSGLLEEIFEVVSRAESVDHALPQVLERALRFIGFERGSIYTFDEERRVLRLRAHRGETGRLTHLFREIPIGQGMVGRAAESGEVVYARSKYVRKPKGMPPGKVVVSQEKTLFVRMDKARMQRILGTRNPV